MAKVPTTSPGPRCNIFIVIKAGKRLRGTFPASILAAAAATKVSEKLESRSLHYTIDRSRNIRSEPRQCKTFKR